MTLRNTKDGRIDSLVGKKREARRENLEAEVPKAFLSWKPMGERKKGRMGDEF